MGIKFELGEEDEVGTGSIVGTKNKSLFKYISILEHNSDLCIICFLPMTKPVKQHLPKFYKVLINHKVYRVFTSDLKFAKLKRKKTTPPIPNYHSCHHHPRLPLSAHINQGSTGEDERLSKDYHIRQTI